MSFSIRIDVQKRLVISTFRGRFTSKDIIEGRKALKEDPAFDPAFAHILDMSRVTKVEMASSALKQLSWDKSIFNKTAIQIGRAGETEVRVRPPVQDPLRERAARVAGDAVDRSGIRVDRFKSGGEIRLGAHIFRNALETATIYAYMRVRIGICLLALCWPLLATAAPVLAPAPTHACCRREGDHHCGKPVTPDSSVSAVCPESGRHLKFAGAKSARPAMLVILVEPVQSEPIAVTLSPASVRLHFSQSSSRAPPFA